MLEEFKLELMPISGKDLIENTFSKGDVFYQLSSGKKIRIIRSGDLITKREIEKYINLSEGRLQFSFLANDENIHFLKNEFEKFKRCEFLEDILNQRKVLNKNFIEIFISGNSSFLDLIISAYEVFVDEETKLKLHIEENSTWWFKRSFLKASLMPILANLNGHVDFNLFKDLYNFCLFEEFCFIESNKFNYSSLDSLKNKRKEFWSYQEPQKTKKLVNNYINNLGLKRKIFDANNFELSFYSDFEFYLYIADLIVPFEEFDFGVSEFRLVGKLEELLLDNEVHFNCKKIIKKILDYLGEINGEA